MCNQHLQLKKMSWGDYKCNKTSLSLSFHLPAWSPEPSGDCRAEESFLGTPRTLWCPAILSVNPAQQSVRIHGPLAPTPPKSSWSVPAAEQWLSPGSNRKEYHHFNIVFINYLHLPDNKYIYDNSKNDFMSPFLTSNSHLIVIIRDYSEECGIFSSVSETCTRRKVADLCKEGINKEYSKTDYRV